MTTEPPQGSQQASRPLVSGVLVRTAAATLVAGALLVAAGTILGGRPGLLGALIGGLLTVGVFTFGAFAVDAVAGVLPGAALLVALLTYTLQVVVMALAFVALSRSGALGDTVSRGWLGGSVIAGTLVWMVVQVVLSMSRRTPIYDLPEGAHGAGSAGTTGRGER